MTACDVIEAHGGIDRVRRQWRSAGYTFAVPLWDGDIDVPNLLVDSLQLMRRHPDLFEAATTWLARFGGVVGWRRLLWLARHRCTERELAMLGHLLETADRFAGTHRFREACVRLLDFAQDEHPFPLHEQSESMPEYVSVLRQYADPTSKRWGVLTGDVAPRYDALENERSVLTRNAPWVESIARSCDVERSILGFLRTEPDGLSKTELARRCAASRSSIHAPAERLIRTRKIEQTGHNRTAKLRLVA